MRTSLFVFAALATPMVCSGQNLLQYPEYSPTHVAIPCQQVAGCYTVLFMQTSIDVASLSEELKSWARGVLSVYPFLAPHGWSVEPTITVGQAGQYTVDSNALALPHARIGRFLNLLLPNYEALLTQCGSYAQPGSSSLPLVTFPNTSPWPASAATWDERWPFITAARATQASTPMFGLVDLARRSVTQAAHEYAQLWGFDALEAPLAGLNDILDREVGFLVTFQAATIKQRSTQNAGEIHFQPPRTIRLRSLKQIQQNPTPPEYWIPWVAGVGQNSPTDVRLYLVDRSKPELKLSFSSNHSNLLAVFETASGAVAVPQSGAVEWNAETGSYEASFFYPPTTVGQFVGIFEVYQEGEFITYAPAPPIGASSGKAFVWAYDPQ